MRQLDLWSTVVDRIGSGESALLISHGGLMEPGAVAAVPAGDHAGWGGAFGHCEGVRLGYDGKKFELAKLLRVPA
jgi:hypothetical protein